MKTTRENIKRNKGLRVLKPMVKQVVEEKNPLQLSTKQLKESVPSAFSNIVQENLSSRYMFIQTSKVIKQLAKLEFNFYPVKADQIFRRPGNDFGVQKHVIVFRSDSPKLSFFDKNGKLQEIVQLYLTNSHDGTTNFMLSLGIFKVDSGNELNIPDSILSSVKIKHVGYNINRLQESVEMLMQNLPYVYKRIDMMKQLTLTEEDIQKFAQGACKIRWKDNVRLKNTEVIKIVGNNETLWNVFAKMQEQLIKGDLLRVNDRKIRPLNHLSDKENFNKKLFTFANDFYFNTV